MGVLKFQVLKYISLERDLFLYSPSPKTECCWPWKGPSKLSGRQLDGHRNQVLASAQGPAGYHKQPRFHPQ